MGNSLQLNEQFIRTSGMRLQQWIEIRTIDQTIYRNVQQGDQYQLKQLQYTFQKKASLLQRAQFRFSHTPRLICVKEQNQHIDFLIERGVQNIKHLLSGNQMNNKELVKYYEDTIRAFSHLKNKFGCFFITENMLQINEAGKLIVWFHQNFVQMEPQFPLPQSSGEQAMIWKINKLFQSYPDAIIMQGQTFAQIILQIQKGSKITTTPVKSSQSVDTEIQNERNIFFIPPLIYASKKRQSMMSSSDSVRKTWNNQNQIVQTFRLQLLPLDEEVSSKSSVLSILSNTQQKKIGSIIKEKCREKENRRNSQIEKRRIQKTIIKQMQEQFQQIKNNRGRSLTCQKKMTTPEFSISNPFIYGAQQEQCSSPLRRQLTADLRKVFSQ